MGLKTSVFFLNNKFGLFTDNSYVSLYLLNCTDSTRFISAMPSYDQPRPTKSGEDIICRPCVLPDILTF